MDTLLLMNICILLALLTIMSEYVQVLLLFTHSLVALDLFFLMTFAVVEVKVD